MALTSFTAVAALRADVGADEARRVLAALPAGKHSPFATSARTHFARLQVIDELRVQERAALDRAVLVFSCDVDGDVESYLVEVLGGSADAFAKVLRLCADAPDDAGAPDFVERAAAYLQGRRLVVGLLYVNSPGPTADAVRRAVLRRRQLAAFAVAHQGKPSVSLRAAFLAEFARDRDRRTVPSEAT
jgi:hypothetical protein